MAAVNEKCQVPTPTPVVRQMLDEIGYQTDIYGKRILENSCGEGAFLVEIVKRYIEDCRAQEKSDREICTGIQRDIHGFEKDRRLHRRCIENLKAIAREFGLSDIHWNIKRRDALPRIRRGRYQFVVGNPPYLSYQDQDQSMRMYLREHFHSCTKGKPDLYYAFIEASLNALAPNGKLAYLVPGNFTKNLHAEGLRQLLLPDLYRIWNYSHSPLFDKYLTSSVILFCSRDRENMFVEYEDLHYNHRVQMPKSEMRGKWIFSDQYIDSENDLLFSNYFYARAPIATQLNRAFVLKNWTVSSDGTILCGKFSIEQAVVRDAAGPSALKRGKREKMIFPYAYNAEGQLIRFSESEFEKNFHGAWIYLKQFYDKLQARKKDDNAQWFEYGRSQLLAHLCQEKLCLSALITRRPNIFRLTEKTVPYAGICVTAGPRSTVDKAEKVLKSESFMSYVKNVGVCTNGVTFRVSPRDINSFRFPRKLLED